MPDRPSSSDRDQGAATATNEGPLRGVRVLDVTWGMTGAFTTMLLADYGAEVVHVERRRLGDSAAPPIASWSTRIWDRGKRTIALDLNSEDCDGSDVAADRRLLRDLATSADVVLVGLGHAQAEALGIDGATLCTANPALVHCDLSAYGALAGDDGSSAFNHPGYDVLAAARLGVMAESPGHRDGPIFPGHPALCYSTGLVATIGILAALRASIVTGVGDRVEVSFVDGVLGQMGMNWWSERNLSFVAARTRTGQLDMGRRRMLLQTYECADGKLIKIHTGAAGAFGRAMVALGIDDRITKAPALLETGSELTDEDLHILRTMLPEVFRTAPAATWLQRLWDHEIAALPIQPPGTVFSDEQVRYAGVMTEVDDPVLGSISVVGPVIHFSDSPGSVRGPAPLADADSADLRAGSWISDGLGAERARTPEGPEQVGPDTPPLAGVRLVEFGVWFASPYGNRLLSDLGADVIKVEPLQGDPIRPLPDPCEGANRGKRSLAIDLKAAQAQPLIAELVRGADIIQHNLRPGVAERLGIDDETVREYNPGVIYGYAPGYGSKGPKSKLQSFAPLLSGFVGLNHLSAGEGNEPVGTFGNEDYYNGLLSATALLLALVHRERTGRGQYVETPQLHSSLLTTSEWYLKDGLPHSTLPALDSEQTGWGWHCRIYQCLEGWIAVAAVSATQREQLLHTILGTEQVTDPADIAERLTDAFYGDVAREWHARLVNAGVPCDVVREDEWLDEFLNDPANLARGRANEIEHPIHGRARVIGSLFHLERHACEAKGRSALLGEHTEEILRGLGCDDPDITRLRADGVIGGLESVH